MYFNAIGIHYRCNAKNVTENQNILTSPIQLKNKVSYFINKIN